VTTTSRRREDAVADEIGHEARRRPVVQRIGIVPLLQAAAVHHADAVADGESLELVVRDEQRRGARALQDGPDVVRQPVAQVGVQAGEGLVQQQQVGPRRQRPRQRHALLLAAGKLVRRAPRGMAQAHQFQHLGHAGVALGAQQMAHAEGHVVAHRQVREQRVVLEHHADAARLGLHMGGVVGQQAAVHAHAAGTHPLQPGHRTQQRRLAAARRADQHADLPPVERQAHAGHRVVAAAAGGVAHADVPKVEEHGRIIPTI
jgi:hypothetical protein